MLKSIAEFLEFRLEYYEVPLQANSDSTVKEDDIYDKVLSLVANRKADIGATVCNPSWKRFKLVDFSPAFYTSDLVMVSDAPPKGIKYFSFFQTFDLPVWIFILSSIPIPSAALYILGKYSNNRSKYFSLSECSWQVT